MSDTAAPVLVLSDEDYRGVDPTYPAGTTGPKYAAAYQQALAASGVAHQLAIRTQQIIQTETNVTAVDDPLGGSWYLESLTDELERRIDAAVRRMEALGDVDTLVESGYFRNTFTAAMNRHSSAVQSGQMRIVGVTDHVVPPEADRLLRDVAEERFEPDRAHVERIRGWRPTRAQVPLRAGLERVRRASAEPDADLMAPILAALDADATIGEITGCLREGQELPADPFEYVAVRR